MSTKLPHRDEYMAPLSDEELFEEEKRLSANWREDMASYSMDGAIAAEKERRGISSPPVFDAKWAIKDAMLRRAEAALKQAGATEEQIFAVRVALRRDLDNEIDMHLWKLTESARRRGMRLEKGLRVEPRYVGVRGDEGVHCPLHLTPDCLHRRAGDTRQETWWECWRTEAEDDA